MTKRKFLFHSKGKNGFLIKKIGNQRFPIPVKHIKTNAHPPSGVAIDYCDAADDIKLYIRGGAQILSDEMATALFPAFLARCAERDVAIEVDSSETVMQCSTFLIEQGYDTDNRENIDQLFLRALAHLCAPARKVADARGVTHITGGAPQLWRARAEELAPRFLARFGIEPFRRKFEKQEAWNEQDTHALVDFLIEHNINPNHGNVDLFTRYIIACVFSDDMSAAQRAILFERDHDES